MANPTGKGGFGDRPQDINREGLNRRSRETWQATVKRITDMTQEEAIAYVGGPKTKLGKLLKEIPPGLPLKDALVFISVIQYGRDPNPRMLQALMDREEGKPNQPIEIKDELTDDERIARLTALLDAARTRRDGQSAGS
jgi:hypothetical protein